MIVRWLLAALHLLALGFGLAAVVTRSHELRGQLDQAGLKRVFRSDTSWGLAALLWIVTGLMRAFGGFEKGTEYYLQSDTFILKMALLLLIIVLEVWPMVTLIRWRMQMRRHESPNTSAAPTLSLISRVQAGLVILMVFAATAMARGYGVQLW